jgi:L-ectoine synthase
MGDDRDARDAVMLGDEARRAFELLARRRCTAQRRIAFSGLGHFEIAVGLAEALEVEAPDIEGGADELVAPRPAVEAMRDRECRGKGAAVDVEHGLRRALRPRVRRQMPFGMRKCCSLGSSLNGRSAEISASCMTRLHSRAATWRTFVPSRDSDMEVPSGRVHRERFGPDRSVRERDELLLAAPLSDQRREVLAAEAIGPAECGRAACRCRLNPRCRWPSIALTETREGAMFVRTYVDRQAAGMVKVLVNGTTRSARFLTAADGMGFSYNENRVTKGSDANLWYKHHWEANYIISGLGEVTDLTSGQAWPLEAGVLYVVGPNDRHRFHITEDDHHLSVFCPALKGDEGHDADGAYAASGPEPKKTDRRMFVKRADAMRAAGKEILVAGGTSRTIRMLTQADDVGFGFSDVQFDAGAEAVLWYKHHWEANHIIAGRGEVTDLTSGKTWPLSSGTSYCVGPRDRHKLRALTDMHLVSIFSPPLRGDEQHDADGTLPPSGPVPPGPAGG